MKALIKSSESHQILRGKIFNETLWVLSGIMLASCDGGGGSATLSGFRTSNEQRDITLYEGQNKIEAFNIEWTEPDETIGDIRIEFSPISFTVPSLEVTIKQNKQTGKITARLPELWWNILCYNIKFHQWNQRAN